MVFSRIRQAHTSWLRREDGRARFVFLARGFRGRLPGAKCGQWRGRRRTWREAPCGGYGCDQKGGDTEAPLSAARAFCRRMCEKPRPQAHAIYGSNDWYYAYGNNSAEQTLRDADLIASCAPEKGPRPFTIIDDGWKRESAFPDMQGLAGEIRSRNVRPGIWIRPLQAAPEADPGLLLPNARYGQITDRYGDRAYDPTTDEGLLAALAKVRQAVDWGYELVKHDYSTYELLGRWGSEMVPAPRFRVGTFRTRARPRRKFFSICIMRYGAKPETKRSYSAATLSAI